MRLSELAGEGQEGRSVGMAGDVEIRGLSADSRRIEPGFLFAALPGSKADGRRFIDAAIARGAVAVLAPEGTSLPAEIACIVDPNPRRRLSLLAARFYGRQPRTIAAVTGTSGKTSTVEFARQIWGRLGRKAASLGTLGLIAPAVNEYLSLTTLDPVELHRRLAGLAGSGVEHLALEASSHGLDQYRLDGVRVSAAAFTNLSRDHLDYHPDMVAYLAAKRRLFTELLAPGGAAVLNADAPEFGLLADSMDARGQRVIGYGRAGRELRLLDQRPEADGQRLSIEAFGKRHDLFFPVAGGFQAFNLLAAIGLVVGCGEDAEAALAAVGAIAVVHGRIERVVRLANGAAVYVDYAHKPGALEAVLKSLRPHAHGKLVVVFGCGGDRDRGKRPVMGAIATELADRVFVTDDNPRSEDPAAIRREIMTGAKGATEIGDRRQAIRAAVASLGAGDLLVIAGKGHETGQIVGAEVLPFDDSAEARAAVEALA